MEAQRLRELMRQEKAKRNRPPPKYAVWREAGQLQCQICKALVNSENLWASHLRSVPHLRVMETLRRQLEEKKRAEAEALARAKQDAEAPESESEEKRAETAVGAAASSLTAPTTGAARSKENKQKEDTTKKDDVVAGGSLRKDSREETTSKEEEKKEEDENDPKRIKLMGPLLPDALYIDQVTLAEVEDVDEKAEEAEAEEGGVLVSGVPDGFFDNEDEEAKARGVKKPVKRREERMEMEMRKFEAQIEKEDQRMHAVRHDLDQVAFNLQSEEEILLIEELKDNAKKMRDEVERLRKCKNEKEEKSSDSGSDIDESLLVLNWRTKGL